MIKYINPDVLINSECLIKNPVIKINNSIINSDSKKIILTGPSGCGKTITLKYMEKLNLNKKYKVIYTKFDSVANFPKAPNKLFDKRFFKHYYEIQFSYQLLNYIKKYYYSIYENSFKNIELKLNNLSIYNDQYIKNIYLNQKSINDLINIGDISSEIIKRLKDILNFSNLILEIDSFDYTHDGSKYAQYVLSEIFPFFDKIVLGVEKNNSKENFQEKKCKYSRYLNISKEIISRRLEYSNKSLNTNNKQIISDKMIKEIINKSNGNLSLILNIVEEIIDLIYWKQDEDTIKNIYNEVLIDQLAINEKTKKKSTKPKFYL